MDDTAFLRQLSEKLRIVRKRGLSTQAEIKAKTGVDQGTISKVLNGKRRRANDRIRKLDDYANILLLKNELPPAVSKAAQEFLIFGSQAELIATIDHGARLLSGRLK
ncbi:MAG: helix-turn-helix transcriptional regulator [Sphingomonas sp.]